MKIRLKFIKQGNVKFVGHLDTIRLFQRAIKVAQIPIAYSQGFNPHSLIYFAMPLSVGVSSIGEYMDIITHTDSSPMLVKEQLNNVLVKGIQITDAFLVEESKASLMSLVSAATYQIILSKNDFQQEVLEYISSQLEQDELLVNKKTKKGFKSINIKPLLLEYKMLETACNYVVEFICLAGSKENLNPQVFIDALFQENNDKTAFIEVIRKELWTYEEEHLIPLEQYRRKV